MKARVFLLFLATGIISGTMGQNTIDLTFTAVDIAAHVLLDSIKVMNRTQGGETVIYWPDTSLSLEINQGDLLLYVGYATFSTVGVQEVSNEDSSFDLYQNYPNPFQDQSLISIYLPQKGKVHMMITDLQGEVVLRTDRQLDGGHHSFRFFPDGGNLYFLTVQLKGIRRSITMITTGQDDGKSCSLDYVGSNTEEPVLKASLQVNDYIIRQSGILDAPEESQTYTFQFATNTPCPGIPAVEYEGQVYNTIQIFSQCWLQKNLNVGTKIYGEIGMSNNGLIEKYCYNNSEDSCSKYGGLYSWEEMMQYNFIQGTQGICPTGWHIPTDDEWKILEGSVDSWHNIGDNGWESWQMRGLDVGTNLKSLEGWNNGGNGNNMYGFTALPGGDRAPDGLFYTIGDEGFWWTSTRIGIEKICRDLLESQPGMYRSHTTDQVGLSVRCLKD